MEAYSVIWNIVLPCLLIIFGVAFLAFFVWSIIMTIAVLLAEKKTREMRKKRESKNV